MKINIRAYGIPKTAGSKKAFHRPGMRFPVIVDDCKNQDWKNAVAWAAKEAYRGDLLSCPLEVAVTFVMPRPKGHYRTGAHAGELKLDAPTVHTSKPDATKLWRCAEDALTGVIWRDDAQIWRQDVRKVYGEHPGVEVEITVANEEVE